MLLKKKLVTYKNFCMIDYNKFRRYQNAMQIVKEFHQELKTILKEGEGTLKELSKFTNVTKDTELLDCNISVRLYNILMKDCPLIRGYNGTGDNGSTPISVFKDLSVKEFLSYKNAGKATLKELQELCHCADISLLP